MEEIIHWLQQVEQLARDVYKGAADSFSEDQKFSSFLSRLSQDEDSHFDLMGSTLQCMLEIKEHPVAAITIDSSIKDRVEKSLQESMKLINRHALTRQDILDCIVKAELSEWNDIFLYVINTFQKYSKRFQYIAASIQAHKQRIEKFLEELPIDLKVPEDIHKLPRIWEQKFLIVEDEAPLRKLFEAVFNKMGAVETATNGQEGLDKLKDHFFNVVISNIEMPVLNGLEFYQKAVEMDPIIGRHFLFCSANVTSEIRAFLQENDLEFIEKPFELKQLKRAVQEIIDKTL